MTKHGIPLIIDKYGKEAFYISDNTIIVTIPINKNLLETQNSNLYEELNDIEKKVMLEINKTKKITMEMLAAKVGVSERYIEKIIKKLKEEKYLERIGSNKNGYWKILK